MGVTAQIVNIRGASTRVKASVETEQSAGLVTKSSAAILIASGQELLHFVKVTTQIVKAIEYM